MFRGAPALEDTATPEMSSKCSADAIAPRENLILPQEKIAQNALPSVCRKTCTCS
jgi:hypothetical protein